MFQTALRGSRVSKISRRRSSSDGRGSTAAAVVPIAIAHVSDIDEGIVRCTTSAASFGTDPVSSPWSTPGITAPPATSSFSADLTDLAPPGSHYTQRVITLAVRLVVEDGLPYRTASWHLWRDHRVFVPFATIQNWVEAAGKKKRDAG